MPQLVRLLPLLLLLPACRHIPTRAECAAHEGTAWREVTSEHFRIVTNLESEESANAARELEQARKSLLFAWQYRIDPPGRLDVVMLQSQRQLEEFFEKGVGFFARDADGPLIILTGDLYNFGTASPHRQLIMHELAHYLSAYALPRQPRWFAEGLASYLEITRPWGDGTEVRMGEAPPHLLYWAKTHARVPFEDLWRWESSAGMGEATEMSHYATSWLWVHFLLNKHGQRFSDLQGRLARAEEPREAWHAAFAGVDQRELERELNRYLQRGTYSAFRFPMPKVSGLTSERRLDDAEVHAVRARLALLGGKGSPDAARSVFDREVELAIQQEPGSFTAGYMRLFGVRMNDPMRIDLARALTQAHPDEPRGWNQLANALFTPKGGPNEERRQAAVKAVQLAPSDPTALNTLAWDYVVSGNPRTALPFARKAAGLAPWSPAILDTWAAALAGSGQCPEAVAVQKRAVDMLPERMSATARAHYVNQLQRYEAGCAQNDGT